MENNNVLPTGLCSLKEVPNKGWKLSLEVNGTFIPVEFGNIDTLRLSSKYGTLTHGKSPAGPYDQWSFHEPGGGGSVIIPWVLIDGKLFIGLVEQPRPLQSKVPVLNIPRGFLQIEGKKATALAEFKEETGQKVTIEMKFAELAGGGNPNSTFFETSGEDEGVGFFAVGFSVENLEEIDETGIYQIIGDPKPLDAKENFVKGLRFHPYQKAASLGDLFTRAALASLLAETFDITFTTRK